MRTLTWTTTRGVVKRITVGGRKAQPLSSAGTTSLDSFEHFLELQRERVAYRLQRMIGRINDGRTDGMTRSHALTETTMESRR